MSDSLRSGLSAALLAAGLASPALAGPTYENASGGSFTFYGQFNPTYQSVDDGVRNYDGLADNVHSNSRVGFYLRQPIGAAKFQFQFETALGFRATDKMSQTGGPNWMDWDRTKLRHVDFSLAGAFGKISAGQGSMASDNAAQVDLSGTKVALWQSVKDHAAGYQFTTAGGALSGIKVGDAFPNFDGGRLGRIRYDSPDLSGFTLSASYGTEILKANNDDDAYDVTVRYKNKLGDFNLESALGVVWNDKATGTDTRDTIGSLSVLHSSGLNGTIAFGDRDTTGNYVYAKLGYKAKLFSIGSTAVAVDYVSGDDLVSAGSSSEGFGLAVVQKIDAANLETYVSYRNYSFDDATPTAYNDVSAVLFGARWKF